jgi:phosphatidylinositol alpha 1,6-mannosyltransferase
MRIVYFSESLLPLVDGVSLTLAQLFDALEDEDGTDFRVYSPFVPDASIRWSSRVRHVRSIAFPLYRDYRVSVPWGHGLADELDAYGPDLIHVASPTPLAAWAQTYGESRGLPVVATFHTNFAAYFKHYGVSPLEGLGWWWLERFYRRCAATFAPSRTMAHELESHGVRNVRLWSRGIDTNRFSPARRDPVLRAELGVDASRPLLLLVSRLVKEKDLDDLIAMDARLAAAGASYRLALVGDGPMRAELEAALPAAHFAGHQRGADLARWYASADVFVFPSTTETFGNVVLESLASGVPAVVVDRGGPQDLIDDGVTGQIARSNDPDDLAARARMLLVDRALRARMAAAARQSALGREWRVINRRLLADYREIIAAHRGAQAAGVA